MSYLIFALMVLLGLSFPRSRVVTACLGSGMWLFLAFADGNADSGVYEDRYFFWFQFSGLTEVGFQALVSWANSVGLSYHVFRMVVAAAVVALVVLAMGRLGSHRNTALAIYLIFPFIMDVVQLRFTIAMSIASVGLTFLADARPGRRWVRVAAFLGLVGLASTFHSVALGFLLALPATLLPGPLVVFVTGILAVFGGLIGTSGLGLTWAEALGVGDKVAGLAEPTAGEVWSTTVRMLVFFAGWLVLILLARERRRSASLAWLAKLQVVMLALIPALEFAPDLYRIQVGTTVVSCAVLFAMDHKAPGAPSPWSGSWGLKFAGCVVALANLYFLVLSNVNYSTVFVPFFESNLFFG